MFGKRRSRRDLEWELAEALMRNLSLVKKCSCYFELYMSQLREASKMAKICADLTKENEELKKKLSAPKSKSK